jgi:hemerythrin-like metal-binding protein
MSPALKFCEWDDTYLVGDLIIDGEHKKFCDMACAFGQLVEFGEVSYREAMTMVREVIQHVNAHFAHEEMLMSIYNADNADLEAHKREHHILRVTLNKALAEVRDQKTETFQEACHVLLDELHDLIVDHIKTMDARTLQKCISSHNAAVR